MTWHSQAGQDEWVHSIVGDSGYFVDVGAHDGVVHSNTYALERLGWDGLCIEPNEDAFDQLCEHRECVVLNYPISDSGDWRPFDGVRIGSGPDRPCRTLVDVLEQWDAPPIVDYLSIDVEGHELEVLAGMDFDRWDVHCITIEHNLYCDGPDRKNAIFNILTDHGFERAREDVVAEGYGPYEDWYVNSTVREQQQHPYRQEEQS